MSRDVLLSAAGLILLGLIVLLAVHQWEQRDAMDERVDRGESPALILEGVAAEAFADNGSLLYRLRSHHARQFDERPRTEITAPHLSVHDPALLWEVTASGGGVEENGSLVRLQGEVRAIHHEQRMEVNTAELHYRPQGQQLWIPTSVLLRHPAGEIRAGTMEADLGTGTIELRDSVESRYEPSS